MTIEAQMPEVLIRCDKVELGYRAYKGMRAFSAILLAGQRIGVIGPSGGGKSLFLKSLAGLVKPLRGTIDWRGDPKVTYMHSQPQIHPHFPFTVFDVLSMAYMPQKKTKWRSQDIQKVHKRLGVDEIYTRPFNSLSMGWKQRVMLTRALLTEPDVLLLDEIWSTLDDKGIELANTILQDLNYSTKMSVIMAEHDVRRLLPHVTSLIFVCPEYILVGPRDVVLRDQRVKLYYDF